MEWRLKDTAQSFICNFMVDGEFVIPDANSIAVTLRDGLGAVLDNQSLPSLSTSTIVQIDTEFNAIGTDDFQRRFISIDFIVNGNPHTNTFSYLITSFLPLACTKDEVRSLYGVDVKELPDTDIDLYEAYFNLKASYGELFSDALLTSSLISIQANNAVKYLAALTCMPGMKSRMMLTEKNDTTSFTRQSIDYDLLKRQFEAGMDKAIGAIDTLTSIVPEVPLFIVTAPTDPITGA